MPKAFSGRAEFYVEASHIFPQGVLGSGGDGDGRLELAQGMRQDSCLLSGHHHPVRGGVWSQVAGAETLRAKPELASFPLGVWFSLSPHEDLSPRGGECWNKWGLCMDRGLMRCLCRCLQLSPFTALGASPLCPSQLITAPCLHCPWPVMEPLCRTGRTLVDSQHVSGG